MPSRIFFASQRVWRSDNRGDKWTAISGDLTRQQQRFEMPIMGKVQSWDEPWDVNAMSNFGTITSLAESPLQEGLMYAGTDDGLIQVTEDGGANWRKIEVGAIAGIPASAFVNDIKADLFDVNTVYVALDNHKHGDFQPYLIKSSDRGRTWQSIRSNLPDRTLVWRLVQDHVKKELLFIGTEFGIYFTINSGSTWVKIKGGSPTISFRDLAIQRRENDLVGASFGRGFFILDDYSLLRSVSEEQLGEEATLFNARKAHWYIPRSHLSFDDEKGSLGADHFVAPNPPFGAVFTYYLKDGIKSKQALRKDSEKTLRSSKEDIPFPGWDALDTERTEEMGQVWLTISDSEGNIVRRIGCSTESGFHRIAWDLKYPLVDPLKPSDQTAEANFKQSGVLAAPGTYTASLSKQVNGVVTQLSKPVTFVVEPLRQGVLPAKSPQETAAFWKAYESASQSFSIIQIATSNAMNKVNAMQKALRMSNAVPGKLDQQVFQVKQDLLDLNRKLNGNGAKAQIGEKNNPTIGERLFKVLLSITTSTYGPTATNLRSLEIINQELAAIHTSLEGEIAKINTLSKELIEAGAPWIESEVLPPLPKTLINVGKRTNTHTNTHAHHLHYVLTFSRSNNKAS